MFWPGTGKGGGMPATMFPYPGVLPETTSTGGALFTAGGIFSAVELRAMEMDGLLRRVYGETYVRWDISPDPVCRALAAAACLPPKQRPRIMLGRLTAAWVYGCAPPPARLALLVDHGRRTTALAPFSPAVLHEVRLGPADGMDIAGVRVSTPLRTASDLARHGPEEESVQALLALAANPALHCPLGHVRAITAATQRLPGKAAALDRLDRAIALAAEETRQTLRREPVVR